MSKIIPHRAVASMRVTSLKGLDYYPTPPWATRALIKHVLTRFGLGVAGAQIWEPACGGGHMAQVLRDQAATVWATDIFDYGYADAVGSFVGEGSDVLVPPRTPYRFDYVITNPPFKLADEFVMRALALNPRIGVAMLVRTAWLEGVNRYNELFSKTPPALIAQFVERVPMTHGQWDPAAKTLTAYCWVLWLTGEAQAKRNETAFCWVPPGQRVALTLPEDARRYADFSTIKGGLHDDASS